MDARGGGKRYEIKWSFSKDRRLAKQFSCECSMVNHSEVASFTFCITEDRDYVSGLRYFFNINNVTVREKDSIGTVAESTRAIQRSVKGYFSGLGVRMNDMSSYSSVTLQDATKESTIACAKALFRNIDIDKEDKKQILEFLESGIISHKELLSQIIDLVLKGNVQAAYDKAQLSEQHGYKGIMYQLGEVFFDKKYIQPAYTVMSEVPKTDPNYTKAQITAAKLAASPEVPFDSEAERLKTIFTHCQNSGQEGQSFIDHYFRGLTKLDDSQEHQIKDVKANFETLASFAAIIAEQGDEIKRLKRKLAKAKESKQETTGSSSTFWSKKSVVEVVDVANGRQLMEYPGK